MPSPEEIVLSVSAAAIAISKNLSTDDTVLLATVFTQLGDTLATIATAKEYAAPQQAPKNTNNSGQTTRAVL